MRDLKKLLLIVSIAFIISTLIPEYASSAKTPVKVSKKNRVQNKKTIRHTKKQAHKYDSLVIGGTRIGPVMLGQPIEKFTGYLGAGKSISSSFFDFPKRKMAVLVKNGIITGIMAYSPEYKTKEGIGIGVKLTDIKNKYGEYLRTDAGSLVYTELGLAFNEKSGKISRIMVVEMTPDPLIGDKMLIPGIRAGNIKIGMDISTVQKYWGKPKSIERLSNDKDILIYKYDKKAVRIAVQDGLISAIQLNSFKFKTPEGIGIDNTRDQVIQTYGKRFKEVKESIMYNSTGIGFYFNKGKVIEILITYKQE